MYLIDMYLLARPSKTRGRLSSSGLKPTSRSTEQQNKMRSEGDDRSSLLENSMSPQKLNWDLSSELGVSTK